MTKMAISSSKACLLDVFMLYWHPRNELAMASEDISRRTDLRKLNPYVTPRCHQLQQLYDTASAVAALFDPPPAP